ncbi:MAG: stage 0 sporulation family protein [Clostridia bacterium]|nr:stage 0 sporulation family protein [Clostridia bacterium]
MAKIIGVKFKNTAKVYYFAPASENEIYEKDSGVVVETAKGLEYGTVAFGIKEVPDSEIVHPLKTILRKADEKDEKIIRDNEKKIPEAMEFANEKIREMKLDMKLIGCEYAFDGKKLVFYFTSDGRVDFRELVKVLAGRFHLRIELRQVGIRDETKILGGIAPCGRTCCCASCMSDFGKVSIKMAKTQGLHLNPGKISGLCGRLMCCLEYENDYYAEVYKKMPKVGGTVGTPEGQGVVVSNDMLKLISKVKIAKGDGSEVYKDFPVDRLQFNRAKNGNSKNGEDDDDEKVSEDMKKILD